MNEPMPKEQDENYSDLYFDGARVTSTIFGVNITLTLSNPHPENEQEAQGVKRVATIRTSLEHAKILSMLLKKQIKTYEINAGFDIKLPADLYSGLKLDENDW